MPMFRLTLPEMSPAKLEEEFTRPVESIMRCEDFKSNFARRLSNRYISRSPATVRDNKLKLRPAEGKSDYAPERIEHCPQLSKSVVEQISESVKIRDKPTAKESDIRHTEVNALNLEVETLRWQLAQTEANRQMHIALLKQIVSFLSRVKEHIECQKPHTDYNGKEGISPKSFETTNLPIRSRSVLHVNKNTEFFLSPTKRVNARKISKSSSNVNGYKDCSVAWSQSKDSLASEIEMTQKITEEMSRLMTLANTVLSTTLPDLACACNDINDINSVRVNTVNDNENIKSESKISLQLEDDSNTFDRNTQQNTTDLFDDLTFKYLSANGTISNPSSQPLPATYEIEKPITAKTLFEQEPLRNGHQSPNVKVKKSNDKKCEANFIEDESGFSSMSSFQEIGIPIISIIPPSPCKELAYLENVPDLMEDSGPWKAGSIDLDKQTMKVFWV